MQLLAWGRPGKADCEEGQASHRWHSAHQDNLVIVSSKSHLPNGFLTATCSFEITEAQPAQRDGHLSVCLSPHSSLNPALQRETAALLPATAQPPCWE